MNQIEARAVMAGLLLNRVKQDRHPSSTELDMIEQVIPPQLLPRYVEVLLDRVAHESRPSISMLHRIRRVIDSMPAGTGDG